MGGGYQESIKYVPISPSLTSYLLEAPCQNISTTQIFMEEEKKCQMNRIFTSLLEGAIVAIPGCLA